MTDLSAQGLAIPLANAPTAVRIGDVFALAWKTFWAHWIAYSAIMLVAYAPLLAIGVAMGVIFGVGNTADGPALLGAGPPIQTPLALLIVGAIVAVVLACAFLMIAHAAIYFNVVRETSGERVSLGRSIGAALRVLPAFLALILLLWLYAMFATLLLVFPAFIVLCVYAVACPACIVERLGPIKSMSRSAFLTKGNRWRIFGLLMLVYIGSAVFSQTLIALAGRVGGSIVSLVVTLLVEGLVGAFFAVTLAALYTQLRVAREGINIDHIAKVFD